MNRNEKLAAILENMGYTPQYDGDGDIYIFYQMKQVYFQLSEDDEENFISILLPQFISLKDGEETMALAVCNKMTRELKLAKVYVDNTFKSVTGACDVFFADKDALKYGIMKSLRVIGLMRSQYYENQKELLSEE